MSGGALVLAAGYGRRFGSDKRLFVIDRGTPMLLETLQRYCEVFSDVAVVLRDEDHALAHQIRDRFGSSLEIVTTANAQLGMAHSLADGIRAMSHWDYAFIALADMPYVGSATLRDLRARMESLIADSTPAILQPRYDGRPGHPVAFARAFFDEMTRLEGDRGARPLLDRHRTRVHQMDVDDPGVLIDVDAPGDGAPARR